MSALKYHSLDWALNLFLIFPATICYWRGLWDLYGYYVDVGHELVNHWITVAIGCGFVLAYFVYPIMDRCLQNVHSTIRAVIVKVTLYAFGILAMAYWRGVWELLDYYLDRYTWKGGLISLVLSYSILLLSGTSRNVVVVPFSLNLDSRKDALQPSTAFGTMFTPSKLGLKNLLIYTMDSLYTHFFINGLSIICWRSMFSLINYIPFPGGSKDFCLFGVGFVSTMLLFFVEVPLARLGRKVMSKMDGSNLGKMERFAADEDSRSSKEKKEDGEMNENVWVQKWRTKRKEVNNLNREIQNVSIEEMNATKELINLPVLKSQKSKSKLDFIFNFHHIRVRLLENAIFFLTFVAMSFLWEGGWNLNSTYIISNVKVGGWVNHVIGSLVLLHLDLIGDAGFCGCIVDEDLFSDIDEGESPSIYSNKYIRTIIDETVRERLNAKETFCSKKSNLSAISNQSIDPMTNNSHNINHI